MDNWMEYETVEQELTEVKLRFVEEINVWKNGEAVPNIMNKKSEEIEFTAMSDISERAVIGNELEEAFQSAVTLYLKQVQDSLVLEDLYARYIELKNRLEDLA
jgi:hypothetical protein